MSFQRQLETLLVLPDFKWDRNGQRIWYDDHGLAYTDDFGGQWDVVRTPAPADSTWNYSLYPEWLFARNDRGVVLSSRDLGHSWQETETNIGYVAEFTVLPATGRVIAIGERGVSRATTDRLEFEVLSNIKAAQRILLRGGDAIWVISDEGHVHYSPDGADSFRRLDVDLGEADFHATLAQCSNVSCIMYGSSYADEDTDVFALFGVDQPLQFVDAVAAIPHLRGEYVIEMVFDEAQPSGVGGDRRGAPVQNRRWWRGVARDCAPAPGGVAVVEVARTTELVNGGRRCALSLVGRWRTFSGQEPFLSPTSASSMGSVG